MNANTITIAAKQAAGSDLTPIEFNGQRVITLAMMDRAHQRAEGTARKRFNDHKSRLVEGVDYFKIRASEFRTRNPGGLSASAHEDITALAESGYLLLVKSFTDDLAWQVQRELVNGYFRAPRHAAPPAEQISRRPPPDVAVKLAGTIADVLRVSDSGRLGMVKRAVELTMPELLGLVPDYAIDAPAGSTSGSSEVTKSATELLKEHGVGMSAIAFNRKLVVAGILEQRTRPSRSGSDGVKAFLCITQKGLAYGKNIVSEQSQRETQPHWFAGKFSDLLRQIAPHERIAGA